MAQNPCLFSEIAITWFSIWWQSISSEKRQSQASRNSQKQLLRSQSCGALHHICMFDIWARSQNKRCLNWIVRILNSKFKLSTCTVCIQERPRNELMWHCAKIFLVLALIFFTSSLLAHCGQEYLDTALITKPWRQQKNTGRKNYVSIHILHTAELFAKHKTDDLSEAHLKMVTHQNLTQSSQSLCASCLPCFKQRSARDPGLGSTIQSPKGPEGEKRHGMKLMKVMKLKVVRIFRVLSFWKLLSTLMVHWLKWR